MRNIKGLAVAVCGDKSVLLAFGGDLRGDAVTGQGDNDEVQPLRSRNLSEE